MHTLSPYTRGGEGGEELDDTCISWRTMERASSCVWIEEGELGEREGERRGEYK